MATPDERYCARCQRPNPEAPEGGLPNEWEVLEDDRGEVIGVICEGCITGEQQQAIDESIFETMEDAERLRLRDGDS